MPWFKFSRMSSWRRRAATTTNNRDLRRSLDAAATQLSDAVQQWERGVAGLARAWSDSVWAAGDPDELADVVRREDLFKQSDQGVSSREPDYTKYATLRENLARLLSEVPMAADGLRKIGASLPELEQALPGAEARLSSANGSLHEAAATLGDSADLLSGVARALTDGSYTYRFMASDHSTEADLDRSVKSLFRSAEYLRNAGDQVREVLDSAALETASRLLDASNSLVNLAMNVTYVRLDVNMSREGNFDIRTE